MQMAGHMERNNRKRQNKINKGRKKEGKEEGKEGTTTFITSK